MADIADKANAAADVFLRAALLNRHNTAKNAPSGTGRCLHCGAAAEGKRWCDVECRDEWQRERG